MIKETTWLNCEAELIARGANRLPDTNSPSTQAMKAFRHRVFHKITLADLQHVREVVELNDPPIVTFEKPNVPEVEDFHPSYPFAYLFHLCLENTGRVPTWTEYWDFVRGPEHADKSYSGFAGLACHTTSAKKDSAIRWRFAMAYCASFYEIWTAVWLRERCMLDTRYHVLADTHMQVDLWAGDLLLCLRVPNDKLERKRCASAWASGFHVVNIDILRQGGGRLSVPSPEQLRIVAGLKPIPGLVTTISTNGTIRVDAPVSAPRLPDAVMAQAESDLGFSMMNTVESPRYSLTIIGGELSTEEATSLLQSDIKVVLVQTTPVGEALAAYVDANLLDVHVTSHVPPSRIVIVDGKADPSQLAILKHLGECIPSFNYEQWTIEHAAPDVHLQVSAGAGTGKTAVMIRRVDYLLHMVDGLDLREIVMVTFTREATRVMRDRLRRHLETRFRLSRDTKYLRWLEELSAMRVSTIPAFAREMLRSAGSAAGIGREFLIREFKHERERIIEEVVNDLVDSSRSVEATIKMRVHEFVRLVNGFWGEVEKKGLSPDEIRNIEWGNAMGSSQSLQALWPVIFAKIEDRLHLLKTSKNAISLSDLTRQVQSVQGYLGAALQADAPIKFLFVDEFQDSDDSQIALVALVQRELRASLFVVGDVKQSIYRFRGATHVAFTALKERMSGNGATLTPYSLKKNYRTANSIVEQLNLHFRRWGHKGLLPYAADDELVAVRSGEGEMLVCETAFTASGDDPAFRGEVVSMIRRAYEQAQSVGPREPERVAVLVRSNWQAALIKRWCENDPNPVFCTIDAGGVLFASQAAHDMQTLVTALLYPSEPAALLNLVACPFCQAGVVWGSLMGLRGERSSLMKAIQCSNCLPAQWDEWLARLRTEPVLSVLRQIISALSPSRVHYAAELKMLSSKYEKGNPETIAAEAARSALQYKLDMDAIMELAHRTFSEDFVTLFGLHEWLELQQKTNRSEMEPTLPDAQQATRVSCITVHSAKGTEYHTVVLPFTDSVFRVNRSELLLSRAKSGAWEAGWVIRNGKKSATYQNDLYNRLSATEDHEAKMEETRLLYVALTRCRQRLLVMRHTKRKETWGGLLDSGEV